MKFFHANIEKKFILINLTDFYKRKSIMITYMTLYIYKTNQLII